MTSKTDPLRTLGRVIRPLRAVTSPVFLGLERIPAERPLLFVGNHTLYGVLDVLFLLVELHERLGLRLRALGDRVHGKVPVWRDLLASLGVVEGTRENARALLAAGEAVLVFPGGGREVAKRKGERYRLIWKERLGFARLAIESGCPLVPFAAIGVEDALDIVWDADDILASPLGRILAAFDVRADVVLPIAKGLGWTPIPRPERLYFLVGEPIDTTRYDGRADDDAACRDLRDRARAAIEAGIEELARFREDDPGRRLLPRLLGRTKRRRD